MPFVKVPYVSVTVILFLWGLISASVRHLTRAPLKGGTIFGERDPDVKPTRFYLRAKCCFTLSMYVGYKGSALALGHREHMASPEENRSNFGDECD